MDNIQEKFSTNDCKELSKHFDRINKRISDACASLKNVDVEDADQIFVWKNECVNVLSNSDVTMWLDMVGQDFENSLLFQTVSNDNEWFPLKQLLDCLKLLGKTCSNISKAFTCLAKVDMSYQVVDLFKRYLEEAIEFMRFKAVSLFFKIKEFGLEGLLKILTALTVE